MQSFTAMSDEGIAAIITANYKLNKPYEFTLNAREYNLFRKAIDFVADNHPSDDLSAWAELFGNSFASPEFKLDHNDFVDMIYALRFVWFITSITETSDPEIGIWAGEFVSSVAESLGIEFI